MATKIYANARFAHRADIKGNWLKYDPVLEKGEPAIVLDGINGEYLKIGDGEHKFSELPYMLGPKGEKGDKGDPGEVDPEKFYDKTETDAAIENAVNGHNVVTFDDSEQPTAHQIMAVGSAVGSNDFYDLLVKNGDKVIKLTMHPVTSYQDYINSFGYYRPVSCDALKEILDKEIGDIETALDELHTYAQSLIEGGNE